MHITQHVVYLSGLPYEVVILMEMDAPSMVMILLI